MINKSNNFERHESPVAAFDNAIALGQLSTDVLASNYAGNYMYMFSCDASGCSADVAVLDKFKNITTRLYDVSCVRLTA